MVESRHKRARRVRREEQVKPDYRRRRWFALGLFSLAAVALVARAVEQQIYETDFLKKEGQRRHLSSVEIPAHRGVITDRHGEVLAVSTPVESVWANPRALRPNSRELAPLARTLNIKLDDLRRLLARHSDKAFVYVKRRIPPEAAENVRVLAREQDIAGFGLQREYRRYYPGGEVFAHLLGFTDVDDHGQEGLELAYDRNLQGLPGKKRVIRDGRRRLVKDVESIAEPQPGRGLTLAVDRRLQFLAYRELKAARLAHKARAASAVILDVHSGEVLAMVNQPGYNPNGSRSNRNGRLRNRALTDVFEPGSTMKPFAVAAALDAGTIRANTRIDTAPGYFMVGRDRVRDHRNYGVLDLAALIEKSSNVGAAKIALDMDPEDLWRFLTRLGFGADTATGFPGEAAGQLSHYDRWARIDQATLSFGYGISVTALQLARAYAVLAADGVRRPISLLKVDRPAKGERVMKAGTARAVRAMLEGVVSDEGTAPDAAIPGYRVAGKTGTARKATAEGYSDEKYISVFAGMAPASNPRLVMVVVFDEPHAGEFYGGVVAGPVFSRVMGDALRLLNVAPDAPLQGLRMAGAGDGK